MSARRAVGAVVVLAGLLGSATVGATATASTVATATASTTASAAADDAPPPERVATPFTADLDVASVRLDADGLALAAGDADPDRVTLLVDGAASSGEPAWVIGTETDGPRWDTTGIAAGQVADDTVHLELSAVDGPGRVAVIGAQGPLFDSADGVPDTIELPVASSGATRWSFGAPGEYRLTATVAATLASGEAVSDVSTYAVRVAEVPTTASTSPGPTAEALPRTVTVPQVVAAPRAARAPRVMPVPVPLAAPASGPVVLAEGHADVAARLVGDALRIQIKDGTKGGAPVWRELSTVVFHARPAGRIEVPDDPAFAFLGTPGDPVWTLPQVQDPGLLWPGWNTEELGGKLTGDVTWTLRAVDGPGAFALFTSGAFGEPETLFNSRDGLPDQLKVPLGTHAHGNWVFGKEGVYRLTFAMSGVRAGRAASDQATLAVAVGAVDPTTVTPGGGQAPVSPTTSSSASPVAGTGGKLPRTGAGFVGLSLVAGGTLFLVGAALVAVTRRRRRVAE